MLLGFKKLIGKLNISDEYGLYRLNEENKEYFLFSCSTYKQASKVGIQLAKLLNIKFENHLPVPKEEEIDEDDVKLMQKESNKSENKPCPELIKALDSIEQMNSKPRRVSGVAKKVKPMIAEGKTDDEIFQLMLPEYLAANRTEEETKGLLYPYLKDIREGKV